MTSSKMRLHSILDTDLYKVCELFDMLNWLALITNYFTSLLCSRLCCGISPRRMQFTSSRIGAKEDTSTKLACRLSEKFLPVRRYPHCPMAPLRIPSTAFTDLQLTDEEYEWLKKTCPYFQPSYLDYLRSYRFKPEQVKIQFHPTSETADTGEVTITITGPWVETILWEVPLMAYLCEAFFTAVDTDWSMEGQSGMVNVPPRKRIPEPVVELAYKKAEQLLAAGCTFSDFGTRRRRSYETQDVVVAALVRASKDNLGPGKLAGSSNVSSTRIYSAFSTQQRSSPTSRSISHEHTASLPSAP